MIPPHLGVFIDNESVVVVLLFLSVTGHVQLSHYSIVHEVSHILYGDTVHADNQCSKTPAKIFLKLNKLYYCRAEEDR